MADRVFVNSETELISTLQAFRAAGLGGTLGLSGRTGGYRIYGKLNGMWRGQIQDVWLHINESFWNGARTTELINIHFFDVVPSPMPVPPLPFPSPEPAPEANWEIWLTSADATAASRGQEIFSRVAEFANRYNTGYTVHYVYNEGNSIVIGVTRTGSITLTAMVLSVIVIVALILAIKIVNYRVRSLVTQRELITERAVQDEEIIKKAEQMLRDGIISSEEFTRITTEVLKREVPLPGEPPIIPGLPTIPGTGLNLGSLVIPALIVVGILAFSRR